MAIPPVPVPENKLYLTLSADPDFLPNGGTSTYTVTLYNDSDQDAAIDQLQAVLGSSPSALSYISGTSLFEGSATSEPSISGSTLTWSWDFTIPANSSTSFTFQVSVPNIAGTYTTTAIGYSDITQIDQTIDTTDTLPATADIGVGNGNLSSSTKTVEDLNG